MKDLVNKLKALSDGNRFRICMMLLEKPLCVCELLSVLDIAGGTLSNHLKILKNAELIDQRKDGKWIEYYIAGTKAENFVISNAAFLDDKDQVDKDRCSIMCSDRNSCSTRRS
ncbi:MULTISPECIES: metalloregulator ArsR/SmtB family transcription factor [unclassified Oceanispirochaeta]|uniref:ArsR/SmtB family transcription factor n=1 Tax=unclassified Oceanispirochaeta TaxID=2635722 RepID=UPI000E096649|nr:MULTISPECIES: metalloregulator ArsR/SmtB family transcription factor [unclassified Oceanispirochaeta]MBF9017353.1 helix-turn-helix transcriptional regulator [Oceanispirochaeta sp. M2]NPD73728.1 helix-turn-helix transcriptional regulator [Oceanispirochaeta sp. M1]RDG30481.1 transcriptional regulator [Oceanispirochaeta sp. M1]